MVTRDSFIGSLENVSDVKAHCAFIDEHARHGDRETLKEIFSDLNNADARGHIPDWTVKTILERIVEALALTNGYDNSVTALQLAADASAQDNTRSIRLRPPAVASKIVAAQPQEVINKLLLDSKTLEASALLLHEAVVRRKILPESITGREIQDRLANVSHPLAMLPLALLDLEEDMCLPSYGIGSMGVSIPFGAMAEKTATNHDAGLRKREITETTRPERANLISAAVTNWKEESNGQVEARTFRAELSGAEPLATIVTQFGLECLGGANGIRVRTDGEAKDAFTILFSAASNGGAYNSGNFSAYGRLFAWLSLAGLVGVSADASVHDIATVARSCKWCIFDASSEWYYQVAWDIGIACFNPAHHEVAVLAATDTD